MRVYEHENIFRKPSEEEVIIKSGINIVIVWKTSCAFELANFYAIKNDLKQCLKKAEIYNENVEEDANV